MFLPQDYKSPTPVSPYTKLLDGETRFRILSRPIIGWEDWEKNEAGSRPVRFRMKDRPRLPIDPKKPIKHFWSMIIWNYGTQAIEVLHITQASIRSSIEGLCRDPDWGAPFFYDIKVTRTGEGMTTEYVVNPVPHKPLAPNVIDEFYAKPCYLEALFDNLDPFNMEICGDKRTEGVFDENRSAIA